VFDRGREAKGLLEAVAEQLQVFGESFGHEALGLSVVEVLVGSVCSPSGAGKEVREAQLHPELLRNGSEVPRKVLEAPQEVGYKPAVGPEQGDVLGAEVRVCLLVGYLMNGLHELGEADAHTEPELLFGARRESLAAGGKLLAPARSEPVIGIPDKREDEMLAVLAAPKPPYKAARAQLVRRAVEKGIPS
jgi:hypothetical protein